MVALDVAGDGQLLFGLFFDSQLSRHFNGTFVQVNPGASRNPGRHIEAEALKKRVLLLRTGTALSAAVFLARLRWLPGQLTFVLDHHDSGVLGGLSAAAFQHSHIGT